MLFYNSIIAKVFNKKGKNRFYAVLAPLIGNRNRELIYFASSLCSRIFSNVVICSGVSTDLIASLCLKKSACICWLFWFLLSRSFSRRVCTWACRFCCCVLIAATWLSLSCR